MTTMPETGANPLPRLELIGKTPPAGREWCATCAMIYLGTVSDDPLVQAHVRELTEAAMERGDSLITFRLPNREDKILRVAITTAPSMWFQNPMPVCWVHLIPWGRAKVDAASPEHSSSLITGKANIDWRKQ